MYKVLLVEDSKALKLAGTRLLTKAGYRVISAEDGERALDLARSDRPDVILLDMMLPKLSGPDVLRSLKQDSATAHIPVVVLTALSQKNEQKLRRDGATAFFGKTQLGEDPQSLLLIIENVLNPDGIADVPSPESLSNAHAHELNKEDQSV